MVDIYLPTFSRVERHICDVMLIIAASESGRETNFSKYDSICIYVEAIYNVTSTPEE